MAKKMRKALESHKVKVKDIFKIISETRARYDAGLNNIEDEDKIRLIAEQYMNKMVAWIRNRENFYLIEGIVIIEGCTKDEEQEGLALNYIVVNAYFSEDEDDCLIGARHTNSKEKVKEMVEGEREYLMDNFYKEVIVIDTARMKALEIEGLKYL